MKYLILSFIDDTSNPFIIRYGYIAKRGEFETYVWMHSNELHEEEIITENT